VIKKSPYEILGLNGDFEFKDIKKAYRKAIRAYPPEQYPKEFSQISDAYDSLTNEEYIFENDTFYSLEIALEIKEEQEIDKTVYLKKIFEVPFKL